MAATAATPKGAGGATRGPAASERAQQKQSGMHPPAHASAPESQSVAAVTTNPPEALGRGSQSASVARSPSATATRKTAATARSARGYDGLRRRNVIEANVAPSSSAVKERKETRAEGVHSGTASCLARGARLREPPLASRKALDHRQNEDSRPRPQLGDTGCRCSATSSTRPGTSSGFSTYASGGGSFCVSKNGRMMFLFSASWSNRPLMTITGMSL